MLPLSFGAGEYSYTNGWIYLFVGVFLCSVDGDYS